MVFYCGEFSEAEDFYKPIHAQHLSKYLPMVEKYLALAPGYRFIIDADGYEDVCMAINFASSVGCEAT